MTTATVLDHVRAYAEAVRGFLADLPPEQVDDLTDGLEADLAEALEDSPGDAGGADDDTSGSRALDLTRRFGHAAAYAAELRAAAGLAAPATPGRRPLRPRLGDRLRARVRELLAIPWVARHWPAVVAFLRSLTPVWWVARGWAWFVIVLAVTSVLTAVEQVLVPAEPAAWLLLGGLVVLSVNLGRGIVRVGPRATRWVRVANVAAVIALVPAAFALQGAAESSARSDQADTSWAGPEYYPEDGVVVDGMAVSNLYVYDAAGEPLTDVQIFDDRGRPVRTTFDDGWGEWHLAEVAEPWRFVPARDGDGRDRWNVYPLRGGPVGLWTYDADTGDERLPDPDLPPLPFAKAPPLEGAVAPSRPADDGADGGPSGEGRAPDADATSPDEAAPDGTTPDGTRPDGATFGGTAPDGTGPDGATSDAPDDPATPPAGTARTPLGERAPVSVPAASGAG